MVFRPSRLRLALQLGAGSVAVHELRYRLGGGHAERSLGDHGHAYLTVLTPLLGILLTLAVAHFVWSVWARRADAVSRGRISMWVLAPALLVLHIGQESLEALLAFGRPVDLPSVLADGNWIVLALCLLVAAVLACLTRGARCLARAVLARRGRRSPYASWAFHRSAPLVIGRPRAPLAHHGAERAPPLLAS